MEPKTVRVETVSVVDAALVRSLATLLPQLTVHATPLDLPRLAAIVSHPGVALLVARDQITPASVFGMVTVIVVPQATGTRARIEDLVVDVEQRGRGVGEALCREALRIAKTRGARAVDLTSNPTRESAHRLYGRLGFVKRDTGVYELDLAGGE